MAYHDDEKEEGLDPELTAELEEEDEDEDEDDPAELGAEETEERDWM
jgi:hypothetical protein